MVIVPSFSPVFAVPTVRVLPSTRATSANLSAATVTVAGVFVSLISPLLLRSASSVCTSLISEIV